MKKKKTKNACRVWVGLGYDSRVVWLRQVQTARYVPGHTLSSILGQGTEKMKNKYCGALCISTALHSVVTHLENIISHIKMLFFDFTSAFSTIAPMMPIVKLDSLQLDIRLFHKLTPLMARIGSQTNSLVRVWMSECGMCCKALSRLDKRHTNSLYFPFSCDAHISAKTCSPLWVSIPNTSFFFLWRLIS